MLLPPVLQMAPFSQTPVLMHPTMKVMNSMQGTLRLLSTLSILLFDLAPHPSLQPPLKNIKAFCLKFGSPILVI
jgi:hypothetical protein